VGPVKCPSNVSTKRIMDWSDDIQVEELENFDFIEEDISELIEEQTNFNMNEYLNSNIDY
jgi:hypothetical protein